MVDLGHLQSKKTLDFFLNTHNLGDCPVLSPEATFLVKTIVSPFHAAGFPAAGFVKRQSGTHWVVQSQQPTWWLLWFILVEAMTQVWLSCVCSFAPSISQVSPFFGGHRLLLPIPHYLSNKTGNIYSLKHWSANPNFWCIDSPFIPWVFCRKRSLKAFAVCVFKLCLLSSFPGAHPLPFCKPLRVERPRVTRC